MNNKPTIFDYLSQVFMIFGISILILNIFCLIFGESANDFSTIFSLGSSGLSVKTMLQFLLAIAITIVFRFLFMSDLLINKMSITARIIAMFVAAFLNIMVFVILCDWFPINDPIAWTMFLVSFAVSCTVSTAISICKEKYENRQLSEALQKLKEEENE
ncbi:MAG: hypothetical protein J1E40_02885 [Oscillospiraceae bacterium]|nr:hypothetical protein [Oscillospiraceae bacterium]